jgi:hypothetical protein
MPTLEQQLADAIASQNALTQAVAAWGDRVGQTSPTSSATYGIVKAGTVGAGLGILQTVPAGYSRMAGTEDPASANWANYQYADGSIMCAVPAFFYKEGTGLNGLPINAIDIKGWWEFESVAQANTAGYALDRSFYNGGAIRQGWMIDKYLCSNNGGIASSIRSRAPLSSASVHNPFSALNGAPSNTYGGAYAAAKTRGAQFFPATLFMRKALERLSRAHAQASLSPTFCAFLMSNANFPKGCNNNALGDVNDASIRYESDGYENCGKTGSANFPARVSHNGQASGVMDLNGLLWEVAPGLTSDGTNYHLLKLAADAAALTGGNTLSTDAFGAVGIAANYDNIGATFQSLQASNTVKLIGSAGQVFSAAVSGVEWAAAGAGIPLSTGTGGRNQFGNDGLWDYRPNELCAVSGGFWNHGGYAGLCALLLYDVRGASNYYVGFRAASYL